VPIFYTLFLATFFYCTVGFNPTGLNLYFFTRSYFSDGGVVFLSIFLSYRRSPIPTGLSLFLTRGFDPKEISFLPFILFYINPSGLILRGLLSYGYILYARTPVQKSVSPAAGGLTVGINPKGP
jgi:hypothetical protein